MASANINLCLVGYGFTAKTLHIPLIVNVPGLNLHSIVQRHPSPGNDAGADHPGAKVYDNVDSALADGDVHVVVVLTGNQTHGELARKALEAGKHGMHLALTSGGTSRRRNEQVANQFVAK